jgi:MFS family permease
MLDEPPADAPPPDVTGSARLPATGSRGLLLQMTVAGLVLTALHATRPMVTYRAIDLGAGPFEIGLVQSAFSVLPVFTAVALGRWIDRIGEGRFLLAAVSMMALASLFLSFAGSLVALAVAQAMLGFGQVINVVAGQAMIANRAPDGHLERHYSWYSTVVSIGQLAGPAIAALLVGSAFGLSLAATGPFAGNAQAAVFLFAAIAGGLASLLAIRLLGPGRAVATTREAGRQVNLASAAWTILRKPGMAAAMTVSITVISAIDVLVAYLPAYGEATGLSVETIGLLLSVRAGASLASRFFMPQLIRLLGRKRLLALSAGMAAAGIALLPFVSSVPVLVGLMVAIGLGLGVGQPMTIAWVANRSPQHERALALGVRVTGNRAALLTVPAAMGALAGASGIGAIWLALAVLLGGGALVAARTPFDVTTKGPDPPTDDLAAKPGAA